MVAEWELEFGGEAPSSVGQLMGGLLDDHMARRMTANQRAAAAWHRANGDRERQHTTGVFLKRPKVVGAAPVLGVYVDSHIMATDFGVNKDIYLARLANIGFAVSGIDFIPSREGYRAAQISPKEGPSKAPQVLPELSEDERKEVQSLVADLPDGLRERASQAIELSKRKQKLKDTNSGETR